MYEVDDERLAVLDELEGHPEYYERVKLDVKLQRKGQGEDSEVLVVEAYFLVKFVDHLLELSMHESYQDNWNGLKYVLPSQRPPGRTSRIDVHKDYFEANAGS